MKLMFRTTDRRSPRGQMIVIVALGLTALVAMAGLVIDGGMAWSNRRQVQNAADAAALAGTRVLSLDLKWRAVNAGNPSPQPAPFPNADAAVCDAINNAIAYNVNHQQTIAAIDCYAGSDDAWYVNFDRDELRHVGEGIPTDAQGVKVSPNGDSDTFLMGVIGISTISIGADATAITGPGEPPLGNLMPFVAQNPLGPWIPGQQYQLRSEDEGECDTGSNPSNLAMDGSDSDIVLAMATIPDNDAPAVHAAPGQPSVPVASPAAPYTFTTSVTVALSAASHGDKVYYTTDGSDPTTSSAKYTTPLQFFVSTTLKAIAVSGSKSSDIGTFRYTQATPPAVVTATPVAPMTFTGSVSVTLSTVTAGSTIYYTTNGSTPTTSSAVFGAALNISTTTTVKAIAYKGGVSSAVSSFVYTKQGDTLAPTANPVTGTQFATTQNVTLSSATPGASIYYTLNGSVPTTSSIHYTGPISLVATTTIRAFATAGGSDSAVVDFTYTKTGPVCPELTSGNFGWVDYSGGSNSNADLKHEIAHPEDADISWYYTPCATATSDQCRDVHDINDPADDHWRLEGTPGNRNISMQIACTLYLGEIIYVPIWDGFELMPKKPNGNNAVFHIIGFAAFRLDGIIDNNNKGEPTKDACADGVDAAGPPNDKGFVGTYVDAFVGTQAAPCIPSADGTNPCANLSNDAFVINLAE
jgi:hypothetical protein